MNLTLSRELILSLVVMFAAASVVLILFYFTAGIVWLVKAILRRLYHWPEPLIADRLPEHLAALQPASTIGERLDAFFQRMVGRSSLNLTGMAAIGWILFAGVMVGSILWLIRDLTDETLPQALTAGLVASCGVLVFFWIMHRRWQAQIQQQLPDTFHLLSRSLRAGLTVDQSVELIGEQGQKPLAGEFKRCGEHLRLGMTVPAAFSLTASRVQLPDFDLLVAMVTLHRQTGGNLALMVDRLAATIRSRNQFRGQVLAVTALGRLSGACIAAAGPLFLGLHYWTYPDYLARMMNNPQGVAALGVAALLEVIGVVWLLWLLRIDY
jgi:tight adherence protein B